MENSVYITTIAFVCFDGYAAVPMVEAMVALVLMDQLMAQHGQCNLFPINSDLQSPIEPKVGVSKTTV